MFAGRVVLLLVLAAVGHTAAPAGAQTPVIDNVQVTVWDVTSTALPQPAADVVTVELAPRPGHVEYHPQGRSRPTSQPAGGRTIVVALKPESHVAPLVNRSGHPDAFPRPGSRTVVDNERVMVSDYTWQPAVPTPVHFHGRNVVVVYLDDGALRSDTPDGASVVNDYRRGTIRYNLGNRIHSEVLATGRQHAILIELKK